MRWAKEPILEIITDSEIENLTVEKFYVSPRGLIYITFNRDLFEKEIHDLRSLGLGLVPAFRSEIHPSKYWVRRLSLDYFEEEFE